MAEIGSGLDSPAIEQDPSVAQIQAAQQGQAAALQVGLPETGFVASINALSGLLSLAQGANIQISSDGVSTITIAVTGLSQAATAKSNTALVPPNSSNDESEDYEIFSMWLDATGPTFYCCADASTMAAVWVALN